MDKHVMRYYSKEHYHQVIPLHESPEETLESACLRSDELTKGWFELSRLSSEDRIEFVKGYWRATLPYAPHAENSLQEFFNSLEDIGIFLTQQVDEGPFLTEMVYILKEDKGFFHGSPAASAEQIAALEGEFDFCQLPADYLAFLLIHDGFCKASDTGMVPVDAMPLVYEEFQQMLEKHDPLELSRGEGVHPQHLIPFYQSFGLSCFQCFYVDWYPEQEMGNLYYSGVEHSLSDYHKVATSEEKLAFSTFVDWLLFYLSDVLKT